MSDFFVLYTMHPPPPGHTATIVSPLSTFPGTYIFSSFNSIPYVARPSVSPSSALSMFSIVRFGGRKSSGAVAWTLWSLTPTIQTLLSFPVLYKVLWIISFSYSKSSSSSSPFLSVSVYNKCLKIMIIFDSIKRSLINLSFQFFSTDEFFS